MARFKLFLLIKLWLLLLPQFIHIIAAKDTTIFINLYPRDYIDPRTAESFTCGIQKTLDPHRLLGELNSQFIQGFLDKTSEPTRDYKTIVYDVASLTKSGKVENMQDSLNCIFDKKQGLYSLFLAPPRAQCNSQTFKDAEETGKDYYPVYINSDANFEGAIKRFESQGDGLKAVFGGQYPKLCGTMTPMNDKTAQSRKDTLSLLFNFAFNPDQTRSININQEQSCRQKNETENAFLKSEMFENTENVGFQENDTRAFEFLGLFETQVVRKVSTKAGIVFIKTKLGENGNTADENDVVPYDDLLVFPKGQNTTQLFITIKIDNDKEEDETFSIEVVSSKQTNKRLKRGAGASQATQATKNKITVQLLDQPQFEDLKDPKLLAEQVINNARLKSQESNSIKDFYLNIEFNHRLGRPTIFLEIYEDGQTTPVNENSRMKAYYFPYKANPAVPTTTNHIGWVDIPYHPQDNQPKVAFTGGMNGCAIIAMEKKNDVSMFRVFHLQSPGTRGDTQWNTYIDVIKNDNDVGSEIGSFAWEDYGWENNGPVEHIQGTNFLYYGSDEKWWYISQFNEYVGCITHNNDKTFPKGLTIDGQGFYMKENQLYNGIVRRVTTNMQVFSGRAPGKTEE